MNARPDGRMSADTVGFRTLLGGKNRYRLLENQRRYAWKKKQIGQFMDDVICLYKAARDRPKQYFFGPMVFARKGKELVIIDGQQRLATVGVFLGVMRDILIDEKSSRRAKSVQGDIHRMLQFNSPERVHIGRIILGEANNKFYTDYIIHKRSAKEKVTELNKKYAKTHPNYWLAAAYCEFYKILKKLLRHKTIRCYNELLSLVLEIFTVVRIIVNTPEDGVRIFETLNERGMRLSDNELLKNYVLGHCDRQKYDYVNKMWESMIDNLKGRNPDEYLRYYWIANHAHVTKHDLFTAVTKYTKTANIKTKIKKYVESLSDQAKIFNALHKPKINAEKWWNDDELVKDLTYLNTLNGQLVKIVLLIARARVANGAVNKQEYKILVRMLISYFYRSKVIYNKNATGVERIMAIVAGNIRSTKKINVREIGKLLKTDKTYPSDIEFQSMFVNKKMSQKIQKYTLLCIELAIKPDSDVEPLNTITVEHIVPRVLTSDWKKQIKRSDHERLLNTIGNVTLLKKDKNIKLGNKPWNEKRKVYRASQIKITNSIATNRKWNKKKIESRSDNFSKRAIQIWDV